MANTQIRIIDEDNLIGLRIHAVQLQHLKTLFEDGTLVGYSEVDCWDDLLDADGDVCMDEDMFSMAREILQL